MKRRFYAEPVPASGSEFTKTKILLLAVIFILVAGNLAFTVAGSTLLGKVWERLKKLEGDVDDIRDEESNRFATLQTALGVPRQRTYADDVMDAEPSPDLHVVDR